MALNYTSDGWYIVRVDTGIGEQYAVVQIVKPPQIAMLGGSGSFDPTSGWSKHYKELMSGPSATAEDAWAAWRAALPATSPF